MSGFWVCIGILVIGVVFMTTTTRLFARNPFDGSGLQCGVFFAGALLVLVGGILSVGPPLTVRTERMACYRYGSATDQEVRWVRLNYFTGSCLQLVDGRWIPAGNDVAVHE